MIEDDPFGNKEVLERLLQEEHGTLVMVLYRNNGPSAQNIPYQASGFLCLPSKRATVDKITLKNGCVDPKNDRLVPFGSHNSWEYQETKIRAFEVLDYVKLTKAD